MDWGSDQQKYHVRIFKSDQFTIKKKELIEKDIMQLCKGEGFPYGLRFYKEIKHKGKRKGQRSGERTKISQIEEDEKYLQAVVDDLPTFVGLAVRISRSKFFRFGQDACNIQGIGFTAEEKTHAIRRQKLLGFDGSFQRRLKRREKRHGQAGRQ